MRRLTTLVVLLAAFAMTVPAAYAGPGCCAKKKTAKVKACGTDGFPAMLAKVGDKVMGCRMTAGKMAKDSGKKIVFVVGSEEFASEAKAMGALADASEEFVGQFVAISCVVDGKVIRCDDAKKSASSGSKAGKQGCGKMAKAGGKGCGKMAKAGSACCKDGKGCTEAKKAAGTCCSSKGKVVKAGGKGCGNTAKAGGKTAKADGKSCHGAGKTKAVKANGKSCCPEGKNVIFRIAGRDYRNKEAAIKAHEQVTAAIKKIQMTDPVDGEAVHCASMIDDKATAAGKVKYCVGESKTDCHLTARVELAKAQFEAAKNASGKLVAKAL